MSLDPERRVSSTSTRSIFDTDGVVTDTAVAHAVAWKTLFDAYLAGRSRRTGDPCVRSIVDARLPRDTWTGSLGTTVYGASWLRGGSTPDGDPSDPPERETVCGLGNRKNDAIPRRAARARRARAYPSTLDADAARSGRRGIKTAIISASRNMREVLDVCRRSTACSTRRSTVSWRTNSGFPGSRTPPSSSRPARGSASNRTGPRVDRGRPRRRRGRPPGRVRIGRRSGSVRPSGGAPRSGSRRGRAGPGRAVAASGRPTAPVRSETSLGRSMRSARSIPEAGTDGAGRVPGLRRNLDAHRGTIRHARPPRGDASRPRAARATCSGRGAQRPRSGRRPSDGGAPGHLVRGQPRVRHRGSGWRTPQRAVEYLPALDAAELALGERVAPIPGARGSSGSVSRSRCTSGRFPETGSATSKGRSATWRRAGPSSA